MAKRLKLRIAKAVSSSFHSCRSKDPSTLPQDHVPSFFPNTQLITPPISKPHHTSSFKHHVSATPVTAGGRCSSRNGEAYSSDESHTRSPSQEFKWKKEEDHKCQQDAEQQPRRKSSYSSTVSEDSDINEVLAEKNKRRISSRKKKFFRTSKTRSLMMMSTTTSSSSSADDESGIDFSNEKANNWDHDDTEINEDEENETEKLISSSMEFSDDSSSDFSQELEIIDETTTTRRQKKIGTSKRRVLKNTRSSASRGMNNIGRRSSVSTTTSSDDELPPRLSVFKKLIPCRVDGKVKESFAILKKSEDPYEDFKSSMMEMILEKQMYEKNDLEQLLQCFLSLNAKHYHGVIVEAFSEIWKTLFSPNHN